MLFFIIVAGIFVFAMAVLGFLFYLLKKESNEAVVAVNPLKETPKFSTSSIDPKTNPFLDVPIILNPMEAPEVIQLTREYVEKESAYQNKVQRLEAELQDISLKAQGQSQEALDTIDRLRKENEELKNRSPLPVMGEDGLNNAQGTIQNLHQEQAGLQTRLAESYEQAQKLQEEVVLMRHQMTEEISQSKAEAERLKVDNEKLRNSLEAVVVEANQNLQDEVGVLKQENQALRQANQEAAVLNQSLQNPASLVSLDTLKTLEEDVEALKQQIQALKKTNNDLLLANQGLKISVESAAAEVLATNQEQMDVLIKENEALKAVQVPVQSASVVGLEELELSFKEASNNLSLANQRIKELGEQNEHLTERTESLQWDLTKTRAQMTSFERACENYQLQLKEALEKKGS